jgi:8-oxo-dGTP diphosphatase
MSKPTFTIGTFVVIFDKDNRVLLCHRRDYDLWNLPGGVLEHGEAPWEGAVREAKEETGLDVEIDHLMGIYNKPKTNDIVFQFTCWVISGKLTLNDEADKIEYFAFEDIPENTAPKQVERIKDALDKPKDVIMKNQFGKPTLEAIKKDKLI